MTYHNPRLLDALQAVGVIHTKDAADPFAVLDKKLGDLTDVTIKRVEAAEGKVGEVQASVDSLAQRIARGTGGIDAPADTWGSEFIRTQGEQIKALAEDRTIGRVSLHLKAPITTAPASAGALEVPARGATALMPRRRFTVRNLLPVVSMTTGSVEFVAQATRPTGAAVVPEGALKPESAMTFALRTARAEVIAHHIPISRQALEDLPQLRDIIDSEMLYGLALAEEAQLLFGDGTGSNLTGLVPNSTPYAAPFPLTSPTMIDVLGAAMLQAALANFTPDGIVLHPSDWLRIRLLKDTSGKYIFGDPQSAVELRIWGVPVVPTPAMTVDKFLVGNFAVAATLYDRWAPRVEVGYVGDQFVRNMATLLAEERVALAIRQVGASVFGDFGNVP
jgi:HK97 family phage major capsid protein